MPVYKDEVICQAICRDRTPCAKPARWEVNGYYFCGNHASKDSMLAIRVALVKRPKRIDALPLLVGPMTVAYALAIYETPTVGEEEAKRVRRLGNVHRFLNLKSDGRSDVNLLVYGTGRSAVRLFEAAVAFRAKEAERARELTASLAAARVTNTEYVTRMRLRVRQLHRDPHDVVLNPDAAAFVPTEGEDPS